MDSLETLDADFNQDDFLNEKSRYYLNIAGSWAKVISVIQIIFLCFISFLVFIGIINALESDSVDGSINSIISIGIWICFWLIAINLFRFGDKIKRAIRDNNYESYIGAFKALKNFMLFAGIVTIILTFFFLLSFRFSTTYYL